MTTWPALVADGWSLAIAAVLARAWSSARSRRRASWAERPRAILLVRPCAGNEPHLFDALISSPVDAQIRIRFAVASEADAAFAIASQACAQLTARNADAQVIVTRARGPNMKADQIARAVDVETAPWEALVIADSDVDLRETSLFALTSPLDDRDVGATWAPPIEVAPRTRADRVSAAFLDGSLHAFALLSAIDPRGMVGKLCALRRDALDAVGGMNAFTATLGEDMEIARRLRAHGLAILVAPFAARSRACERSWADVIVRYTRWLTVIRAQRPLLLVSYPLLFGATPLVVVLSLALAMRHPDAGLLALVIALSVRAACAVAAHNVGGASSRTYSFVDVLGADVVLLAAFARALVSRNVAWRGASLAIDRDGTLVRGAPP